MKKVLTGEGVTEKGRCITENLRDGRVQTFGGRLGKAGAW